MTDYAVYDIATGAIGQVGSVGQASLEISDFGPGNAWLERDGLVDGATHYVDLATIQITDKQPLDLTVDKISITADGADTSTISGIPEATTIIWPDRQANIINDGLVEFSVDLPGTYTLKFSAIPYLDQEVTIEAVSAT